MNAESRQNKGSNYRRRRLSLAIFVAWAVMVAGLLAAAAGLAGPAPDLLRALFALTGLAAALGGGLILLRHQRWTRQESLLTLGDMVENEERMRLALEGADLAIWDRDIRSGVQIVSPEWYGMLGYAAGEVGTDFESWKRLVHPDDLPGVLAAVDEHLQDRRPYFEAEYRLRTRGGDWKWILARGRVVARAPGGEALRMAGTHRDISAQKIVEAQLAAHEERQRSILASLGEAVWSIDPDFHRAHYVSPAVETIFGRTAEEFLLRKDPWMLGIHPDDLAIVEAACQSLAQREQVELIYRILRPDGEVRWVRSSARLLRDSAGVPLRVDGVTLDITDRKRADEALTRRDEILDAVRVSAEGLLSAGSWREALPGMLALLGEAAQASRAYVFEVADTPGERISASLAGEWTAPGIALEPADGQTPARLAGADGMARWRETLATGQILQGDTGSFPASEQPALRALGIRALIAVPIHTGSCWWGFIGFDDCARERSWLNVETDVLKVSANLLAAAIQRQQLFESEREERRVAEEMREISSIFSQTLNYDSILDRMLEQIPRIVPFDSACVMLIRGETAYIARERGESSPWNITLTFDIPLTPNLRRLVETRAPVVIADTLADPEWLREKGDDNRSWAGAPLTVEGRVDAILCLRKREPNFFTPGHVARLSMLAGQAGLALRNAQLFAETLEALEHEQQLGEISRAISSELDLPIILQHVVRLAVELAKAEAGSMAILDMESQTLSYPYLYNLPQELSREVETRETGIAWETILNRRTQLVEDYAAEPRANPRWVETGIHALIAVPVVAGNTVLGGLSVASYDYNHHFELRDLGLVELVGRQAGIAIQNARLFESAQRRAAEAETLRQAASVVSSALSLSDVLDKILEQLEQVVPYDSAAIFLVEENRILMKAGRGFDHLDELKFRQFPTDDRLFQEVEASGQPLILEDAMADPRFQILSADVEIRGWIGLVLRVRDAKIGFMTIDSRQPGAYRSSDGEMAQAFADEVAIAIENARLFEQVQQLAITDPLTGLFNRRYFFEAARREFERARRYSSPLSVIMIDLDHFKQVNDTYGHLAGDKVLVELAARGRQSLREVDVLARYGGEEFIYLLPQTGLDGARLLAERLRERIMDQPVDAGSQHISVTASLGIAELDPSCADILTLIQHADQALYSTKAVGRGGIVVWDPTCLPPEPPG